MPISPGNIVTLNWTNPGDKPAITVPPGTHDTASTSLDLIGQGYPGWAVPFQENFLKLLENFASSGAPPNPTVGQLWYDTITTRLYVCTDPLGLPAWREVVSFPDVYIGVAAPDPAAVGYLWYEPVTKQLSVCSEATVIAPPTPAVWIKVLTFNSIISATQPSFPRIDGQLWYDTISRALYAWDSTNTVWDRVGPTADMDVIGGSGWNEITPWLNKILSTPTNTNDNLDPFTENNSWGYNQLQPFGPYYSAVPGDEWLRLYDTVLGLGTLLGISTSGLTKQDFTIPGTSNNQYGIPFMLTQWDLIQALVEQFKSGRMNIAGPSLEFSNSIIAFTGTANAGSILGVTAPTASGFAAYEEWTVTATSATNFTVSGSVNGAQAAATVGVAYANAFIEFTINAGVNPFIAGDEFFIKVLPNLKSTYTVAWGAGNSGVNVVFDCAFNDIAHQRSFFNAGGKLKITPTFADTTAGHNQFWNQFLTAVDHIQLDKASTSWGIIPADDPAYLGYFDLTSVWQTILYLDSRILPSSAVRSYGYSAPFTASAVVAGVGNVGNGTVGVISGIDANPLTSVCETWTMTATSPTTFAVVGSTSGAMAALTVGVAYTNAHFGTTITAGGTPFDVGDSFVFSLTGVNNYVKLEARLTNGDNNIELKLTLNDTSTVAVDSVTTGPLIAQLDMVKANATFLNNPEIPYPNVTLTPWAP